MTKSTRLVWLAVLSCFICIVLCGCNKPDERQKPPFVLHSGSQVGLDFQNTLTTTLDFNILNYMYFFNGGGVAAGDFNNDGLVDLYFTANQLQNKLFLNRGNLRFEDVTTQSGTAGGSGWKTGVATVDINNDGLLDIYVSKVGDYRNMKGKNELFICIEITPEGVPVYEERAAEYGIDLVGFGTQASFFDFDLDGDLDMYQMNHSLHQNGTFGQRKTFDESHPLAGDRLLRNDDGHFTDVTQEAGIYSSVIGYGLGIATGDINLDGYPDIYIANDFHENDYLYINNGNGTFSEVLTQQMQHTSRYSMGVDIGDINNDGLNDIFSLDMHPEDPKILKSSMGEEDYGVFLFKLGYGYNHQYARNTLQLNNGNSTFSEVGMYSGVYASDWSWATLLMDFNNDGLKDIFVSNGIPKRMNDIDYISFYSTNDIRYKVNLDVMEEKDLEIIEKMPEIKIPNKFWLNDTTLQFRDISGAVEGVGPSYSNGAIYADLDNDGDLDIVVNNINDYPFLYENKAAQNFPSNHYLKLDLQGPPGNVRAIGAKVIVKTDGGTMLYENFPVRGYQSAVDPRIHIGLGNDPSVVRSMTIVWPDQTFQEVPLDNLDTIISVRYNNPGSGKFNYNTLGKRRDQALVSEVTQNTGVGYRHNENEFVEFNREKLIPHMTSTEGPALAIGDLNGDGKDDIFFGSAKHQHSEVYLQTDRGFELKPQPLLIPDSVAEIVDAVIVDVNNDGHADILAATGGNEWYNNSDWQMPRLYLNDGTGTFQRDSQAFSEVYATGACIEIIDLNNDGFIDCFLGARAEPWKYGQVPRSYLLLNDGSGRFSDVTEQFAPGLQYPGLVKDAIWVDLDGDGDKDLLLALEWGPVAAFIDNGDTYERLDLSESTGWWNFVLPADYDGDGDIDFIAGNLGLNSKLRASESQPVRMYVNDFDDNEQVEQVVTYYSGGREILMPIYAEVVKQMPVLKKRFLYARDFAEAGVDEVFDREKLDQAIYFEATEFANSYFENKGNLVFERTDLPQRLQFSPLQTGINYDFDDDGLIDVMLLGNFYENNVELGRHDADYGTITLNSGEGFSQENIELLKLTGQFRQAQTIKFKDEILIIAVRNDGPAAILKPNKQQSTTDDPNL